MLPRRGAKDDGLVYVCLCVLISCLSWMFVEVTDCVGADTAAKKYAYCGASNGLEVNISYGLLALESQFQPTGSKMSANRVCPAIKKYGPVVPPMIHNVVKQARVGERAAPIAQAQSTALARR